MKKIILLLSLLSFPCWGEWVPVSKNSQGDTTYFDNKSLLVNGPYLQYWELSDYKNHNQYGYISTKIFKQVNCNSTIFQTLRFISFTKPMGKGEIIKDYNPNEKLVTAAWGSSNYHSLRAACESVKKVQ
tara:strand:+ start:52 stop:438 length:387 start_codon:yes stop_codon:yes gene_type:complete